MFPVARAVTRKRGLYNNENLFSWRRRERERERDRDVYFLPEEPRNRARIDKDEDANVVEKRRITLRSADVIYERVKETPRGNLSSLLFVRKSHELRCLGGYLRE